MMRPVRRRLSSGTVAFLVTDVEGSEQAATDGSEDLAVAGFADHTTDHTVADQKPRSAEMAQPCDGRYRDRTSDLLLVRQALSQLS
jgi:hypothetical protein